MFVAAGWLWSACVRACMLMPPACACAPTACMQAVAERSQSTWAAFKAAVHEEVQSAERGLHKQVG